MTDLTRSVTLPGFQRDISAPRGVYGQAAADGSKIDESFSPDLCPSRLARSRGGGYSTPGIRDVYHV